MVTQGDATSDSSSRARRSRGDDTDDADLEIILDDQAATDQSPDRQDRYSTVRKAYPPILNTAQVAELLDLNPRTVLNMAGDGRLPASRLPGSRKFHFLLEDIITTLEASKISD